MIRPDDTTEWDALDAGLRTDYGLAVEQAGRRDDRTGIVRDGEDDAYDAALRRSTEQRRRKQKRLARKYRVRTESIH